MIANVRHTIRDENLLEKGDRVLVAVSGGVDSMVLLDCLLKLRAEFGIELAVVHVEHGLRGDESLADAHFVEAVAENAGMPFFMKRFDVAQLAEEQGVSTQVAAREVRYRYLVEAGAAFGAQKIATAHHADDQAETVLMRILRGTTLRGLGGIPITREESGVTIVRPFLHVWREEIASYATKNGILYREDSSNASTKYLRNKIRIHLLPLLTDEYNAGVKSSLVTIADWAREDERLLAELAEACFAQVATQVADRKMRVDAKTLAAKPVPLQRRVITLILYYLCGHTRQWEHVHIELVRSLLTSDSPSAEVSLPDGLTAWREYDLFFVGDAFSRQHEVGHTSALSFDWHVPGALEWPGSRIRLDWEVVDAPLARPKDRFEAHFDADELSSSCIYIRTWARGDLIRPFGFHGSKLISDVLGEAKVPKQARAAWPLLFIDDQIAWVIGIRRGQQAVVTEQTRRIFRLRATMLS